MKAERLIEANRLKAQIFNSLGGTCTTYGMVRDIIDSAPTVDLMRREKWELHGTGLYTCTGCGQEANKYQRLMWDYCPKCGAAMWRETDG